MLVPEPMKAPPEVLEQYADLKAERALVFASCEGIVAKYGHRDRMPARARRRLETGLARLKEIHEAKAAIVDAWGDEPELPYLVIPRWDRLVDAIELVRRRTDLDPASKANADRVGAMIRNEYDAQGLRITDPETLYVSLVAVAMVVELAQQGIEADGPVDARTLRTVALVAETFTASIIPHLPKEAFGR